MKFAILASLVYCTAGKGARRPPKCTLDEHAIFPVKSIVNRCYMRYGSDAQMQRCIEPLMDPDISTECLGCTVTTLVALNKFIGQCKTLCDSGNVEHCQDCRERVAKVLFMDCAQVRR